MNNSVPIASQYVWQSYHSISLSFLKSKILYII